MPPDNARRAIAIAAAAALALQWAHAGAGEALVAVAANFAGAAERIAEAFAEDSAAEATGGKGTGQGTSQGTGAEGTGHVIRITTGSTGKLFAQISEGAPFDILLAADAATPERLETEGFGVPGTRFTYAIGGLSLWSGDASRDLSDAKAALTSPDTLYIAIANPELAPYGVAAREAMRSLGVWDEVRSKIVMGQNIGQTYSLVDSGAAQMGFVATSALDAPGVAARGARLDIAQDLFTPIRQDAILLKAGENNPAATEFIGYLRGDRAREIARSFGYGTD